MADLAVSLLSADFSCLEKQLQELKEADVKWLHIDVMDGNFVPSISFGFPIVKTLRKAFSGVFDVHLMIQEPIRYIKEFAESGSDMITIHLEACEDVEATLRWIRECGCKAGLAVTHIPRLRMSIQYLQSDRYGACHDSTAWIWRTEIYPFS